MPSIKATKKLYRTAMITKFFPKAILRETNSMLRIFWVAARTRLSRKNYRISSKIPKEFGTKKPKAKLFPIHVATAIKI